MSMHRVGSMESWEHDRSASPARSHRKMSFNPVNNWVPPTEDKEPLKALEVSKAKRILQVCIAVVYCLLSAGIVFGYAAIKPVLIREGVYRDQCTKKELKDHVGTCYGQEIRLNLMFTIAAVATNVCALPVGTILDKYGPRISGIIGSVLIALGAALFAFASSLPFDGYIPGYLFLALGGPFVFISSFQLSNTFPAHSGLILSMLTGAFDSSSALFLLFRLLSEATNGEFNTRKFFLIYLIVPVFILVIQITLMPSYSYKTVGELVKQAEDDINAPSPDDASDIDTTERDRLREERRFRRESIVSEITSLLDTGKNSKRAKREDKKNKRSGVWGAMHGYSALQQIKSPLYEYILHSPHKAEMVNNVFDVGLPLGGVLSVPFIGGVLDHTSTTFTLALLVTVATAIGVLGCLPYMWAAYANVALFVIYRPFYYTAVSDYAAKVFGFQTFGKVYGLIICFAGILNFSQSLLDTMTHKVFHRDPLPVNLLLLGVALVVGGALVGFVWRKSQTMKRNMLEDETEGARETLMPTANGSNEYGT